MNTKIIMTSSAVILGIAGMTFTFLPEETLVYFGFTPSKSLELIVQIIGALYFAFAFLNWMVKSAPIGGIYNRPIIIANLSHFMVAGLALIKGAVANLPLSNVLYIMTFVYVVFAILFGFMFYTNPNNSLRKRE